MTTVVTFIHWYVTFRFMIWLCKDTDNARDEMRVAQKIEFFLSYAYVMLMMSFGVFCMIGDIKVPGDEDHIEGANHRIFFGTMLVLFSFVGGIPYIWLNYYWLQEVTEYASDDRDVFVSMKKR